MNEMTTPIVFGTDTNLTTLDDLVDPDELGAMIATGYVRVQVHPTLPYRILNYTEKTQFDNVWNDVTKICRGLIVDVNGRVVARPFSKFFNYGDPHAATILPSERIEVTDKIDGSLGILYPITGGHAIATRGSFTSDQALHATKIWQTRYADTFYPPDGVTMLFEIIYPENRIVLNYHELDDLILLGGVETATGNVWSPRDFLQWHGLRTDVIYASNLAEAVALIPRENAEGVVVRSVLNDGMIKLKQDDYVILHKLVTGLTTRRVWEHLGNGGTVGEMCEPLPDEWHDWVRRVASELLIAQQVIIDEAHDAFVTILAEVGLDDSLDHEPWTREERKRFAAEAVKRGVGASWLFMLFDGRSIESAIWSSIRPSGDERPITVV